MRTKLLLTVTTIAALAAGTALAQVPNATGSQSDQSGPAQSASPGEGGNPNNTLPERGRRTASPTWNGGAGLGANSRLPLESDLQNSW